MNFKIKIADAMNTKEIIDFFDKHLDKNDKIIPREFFCKQGVIAAVKRKQVIVGLGNEKIISAIRFYKKKDGSISIYQVATDNEYDKKSTEVQMLRFINNGVVERH